MNRITPEEFITMLGIIMDKADNSLRMDTKLETVPEWDSINVVTFIVFCDEKLNVQIAPSGIENCKTIADLYQLAMSMPVNESSH